jgi:hypothetical protein
MEEGKEEVIIPGKKRITRGEIIQISFLVLMLISIILLIGSIITIYKNMEALRNPMGTNMKNFGMLSCSCTDENGVNVKILAPGFNESLNKSSPFDFRFK